MAIEINCVNPGCRAFEGMRNIIRRGGTGQTLCGNKDCRARISVEAEPDGQVYNPKRLVVRSLVGSGSGEKGEEKKE